MYGNVQWRLINWDESTIDKTAIPTPVPDPVDGQWSYALQPRLQAKMEMVEVDSGEGV